MAILNNYMENVSTEIYFIKTLINNILIASKKNLDKEDKYLLINYYVEDFQFFYNRSVKIERYNFNQYLLFLIKKAYTEELYELLAVLKHNDLLLLN